MPTLDQLRAKLPELQGLDDSQALDVIHQVYYPTVDKGVIADRLGVKVAAPVDPNAPGDFSRGFKKALYQIPQTAGGALALGADMVGADGVRDYGMGVYKNYDDKINAISKPSDSLTSVLQGEDGADAGSFLKNAAGYTAGQALTALATGGVGGMIGKQLALRGIKDVAERAVESQMARKVAEQVASKGMKYGAGAALGASNLTQEAGSIYPDALEQAQQDGRTLDAGDKARIAGSALAAAAVDTGMEGLVAHKILTGGRREGESLVRAALREAPGMAAKEAATEGIQTGIERYGAGQDMSNADAVRDYVDSMGVGAVGGGLGGGVSVLHAQHVPESGPLTRAANAAIDAQAATIAADPDPVATLGDGSQVHKADLAAYLNQFSTPEQRTTAQRQLMGLDPDTGKPIEQAPAEPPKFAASQEQEDATLAAWGAEHKPATLKQAQALKDAPGAPDGLMVAPHPDGKGYTLVPSHWLTLDSQAKYAGLQKPVPTKARPKQEANDGQDTAAAPADDAAAGVPGGGAAAEAGTGDAAGTGTAGRAPGERPQADAAPGQPAAADPVRAAGGADAQPALKAGDRVMHDGKEKTVADTMMHPSAGRPMVSFTDYPNRYVFSDGLSKLAPAERHDGTTALVPDAGLTIVHGSGNDALTSNDVQIVRTGQKQGKKGRSFGGFYGTSEDDAAQAEGYANMMGGNSTLYDVKVKPGTKVLHKVGDITRLSETYINELVGQGYGLVVGTDPRGRTEYVVIDKNAIASMGKRGSAAPVASESAQQSEPAWKRNPYTAYKYADRAGAEKLFANKQIDPGLFQIGQDEKGRWVIQNKPQEETKGAATDVPESAQVPEEAAPAPGAQGVAPQQGSLIDQAAHEAATSPHNDLPEPSAAQAQAGNYKLGHVKVNGLDISVENPAGSVRQDKHNTPPTWQTDMHDHYGYFKGVPARASDKDHVDVFVKPGTPENFDGNAYIVDQNHPDGKFDEPKVVLGATSPDDARATYLRNYQKGWESRIRGIRAVPMDQLKAMLQDKHAFTKAQPAEGNQVQSNAQAAPALRDTRSGPDRFHGTSRPLKDGKPNNEYAMSGDSRNIYGQGFYTTDAADIAHGYMKKGKGGQPSLYHVMENGAPKLYDMEQAMTPEVRAMAERAMGDAFPNEDINGKPVTTLRQLFDEYRAESQNNGLTRDDVQEVFDAIRYNLEKEGYRGYSHVGGDKTGSKAHAVRIYWTPEDDIKVRPDDIARYRGEAPAAPVTAEPADQHAGQAFLTEPEARAYLRQNKLSDTHRVKQVASDRYEIASKAQEGEGAAKLAQAADKHARQDEAVRRAAENIARRQAEKAAPAEADPAAGIPKAFFKKVKVPHDVWVEDESRFETHDVPADQALASVREDIGHLEALLNCMRGH